MKIAFIGNMNNINFSLMRYFRDLGADAHLLLWANEGKQFNKHFLPENDTWDLRKWSPYIHRISIDGSFSAFIGAPSRFRLPPSKRKLLSIFYRYDAYVGGGLAPAILGRCGIDMDIFYPFSTGIEFVASRDDISFFRHNRLLKRTVAKYIRKKQIDGIKRARFCVNAEMSLTRQTFKKIGKDFIPMAIPMVYNGEVNAKDFLPKLLKDIAANLAKYELKIFSHASHTWVWNKNLSDFQNEKFSKHNDWLIKGFADFIKHNRGASAVLLFIEYGPDVEASKKLCTDLDIDKNVIWLPIMPRHYLMYLLGNCDIGAGEFCRESGLLWGGTGWEVLSSGKPLLQTFNFDNGQYQKLFGHESPPILDVKSSDDVAMHLQDMLNNKDKRSTIGNKSMAWFNNFNGAKLAEKWLDLIM